MPGENRLERLGDSLYLSTSAAHTFGSDAFLLARFAGEGLRHKDIAADLGTGCGIIAFLLYKNCRPKAVYGVDIQPEAIRQFTDSLRVSEEAGEPLDGILRPVLADLNDLKGRLPFGVFDLVTCNPPYKAAGSGILSSGAAQQIARHELACTLDGVCRAAAGLLKTGGRFVLCQRPERLTDILCSMRQNRLEPKRMQLVAKDADAPPWLVLVEGKKDARPSMRVLPPLIFDAASAARITGYGPSNR